MKTGHSRVVRFHRVGLSAARVSRMSKEVGRGGGS